MIAKFNGQATMGVATECSLSLTSALVRIQDGACKKFACELGLGSTINN